MKTKPRKGLFSLVESRFPPIERTGMRGFVVWPTLKHDGQQIAGVEPVKAPSPLASWRHA